ncbi:calcium-binding and coiled-coil domain-containing protein 2-like [Hemibagrus wyckioides]|uniref:calcium-binding and coiled-coil domain-containing protein 2-like n=1 Tax=Hemibagrus wyckioides TaxID=337641 RepID=UPI00266DA4D9|nr:calcium-binding and coiled-coil domain-containing protein 2-like [Hemibagrus wyckioides]
MVWIQLLLFSHLLSFTPLTTLSRSELEDQLKKKKKNISDLEKDNKEIEDQLKQKEKELSDLREKNADVMSENERLRGDVKKLNNRVKALEKSEDQLRQTEKEISELKRKNNKLLDEKENLQDVTKLKKQLKDLEKAVTTSFPVTINSLRFDPNTAHSRLQISDDWQSASVFGTLSSDPTTQDATTS